MHWDCTLDNMHANRNEIKIKNECITNSTLYIIADHSTQTPWCAFIAYITP
jgi:hypothetical protein